MRAWILLGVLFLTILVPERAESVEPDEILQDPVLEQRARAISRELRCVVCQSENIDDSNAPLAKDLRLLVRERLTAGDTDRQVIEYVVERYGDYVLLKPPVQQNTVLLWSAPLLFSIGAATIVFFMFVRRRTVRSPKPLTDEETRALDEIVG